MILDTIGNTAGVNLTGIQNASQQESRGSSEEATESAAEKQAEARGLGEEAARAQGKAQSLNIIA